MLSKSLMLLLIRDSYVQWALLLAAGILFLYLYCWQQLRIIWTVLRLPGPFSIPLLGHIHWVLNHSRLYKVCYTARYEYGPIVRAWITIFPIVFVLEPKYIQKVLASSKHTEKVFFYRMMHNFLGEGLITSDVPRWKQHRKLLQPSFHITILEDFMPSFNLGATHCIQQIQTNSDKHSGFNIAPIINQTVVYTLNEAILGAQVNQKNEDCLFRQGEIKVQYRCVRPWLLFQPIYKMTELAKREIQHKNNLVDFMKTRLQERRQAYARGDFKSICFLDHLLQIEDFSEDDCIQEACTLMLAGQDSVGAAVAFCIHHLANNPDIQDKAYNELRSIFEGSLRPATAQDLRGMQYLEQCIKETMRLCPSVPLIGRTLAEDVQMGEWLLPKGCNVYIAPYATHKLKEHYPNPKKFDPERFSPKEVEARHPYAYLPFSLGPRNCIGYKFAMLEMKTIVSTILRKYQLLSVRGKEKLRLKYRITLRASGGIWVRCVPREEQTRRSPSNERKL